MKKLLLTLALFLAPMAFGADVYVAQTSAGANNGTSCANARAIGALASCSAGDVIHFCGTITSNFAPPCNGTSGNPVELRFEAGAKFSAAGFSPSGFANGIINLNNTSWITVNGDATGGKQGIIERTSNGSGSPYTSHTDGCGISIQNATNFLIKNLTIQNLYVHNIQTDPDGNGYGVCQNSGTGGGTNRITNVDLFTPGATCFFHAQNGGSLEIDHFRCEGGISWGFADFSGVAPAVFRFHDGTLISDGTYQNPTSPAQDLFHNDPFHIDTVGSANWTDAQIYNIYTSGNWGGNTTGGFYFECGGTATSCPFTIYNNVFNNSSSYAWGAIALKSTVNVRLYNNTFYAPTAGAFNAILQQIGSSGTVAQNNIFVNTSGVFGNADTSTYSTRNYNIYYNISGGQAAIGANDRTTNPNLDANFKPQAGSIAIGNGSNLTSLGITPLNSDKNGVARGSSWDIGALQYSAASGPITKEQRGNGTFSGQTTLK